MTTMLATDFYNSHSFKRPFVQLADGSYRYLRPEWESRTPPIAIDGPDPGWVARGLESGDVCRLEVFRDTTLHMVNRMMPA